MGMLRYSLGIKVLQDASNKWVARSAFQKAVRRGNTLQAIKMGSYLYNLDPFDSVYFWYTMVTVAFEDIGLGNPKVVSKISKLFRSKKLRDNIDGRIVGGELIQLMCEGPKTRSFCEVSLANDLAYSQEECSKLASLSDDKAQEAILGDDVHHAYNVLRVILGKVEGISAREELRKYLRSTLPARISETYMDYGEMVNQSLWLHFDTMVLGAFPVCNAVKHSDDLELITDNYPTSELIGGIPSEALDMHTHIGKIALKAYYTSVTKDKNHVMCGIVKEMAVKAIGATLFVVEGGLLNNRITSPVFNQYREYQDFVFMEKYGVPPTIVKEVAAQMVRDIPILNEKRKWAWELNSK